MAKIGILTGQYVLIRQTAASVGDRILAQLIDWGVLFAYGTLTIWTGVKLDISNPWFYLVGLFPLAFYTLACEVFNQGQSLGKKVMHTRVVMLDGRTPTLGAFLLRWLIYIIDGPLTCFMGLLVIALTRHHQRLGDLAAGTMVIKLQDYRKIQVSLDDYDNLTRNYTPRYPKADDLSLEQIEIITRTLQNPSHDNDQRLATLSGKVQQFLGIQKQEDTHMVFLQRILRDYQYYALEDI